MILLVTGGRHYDRVLDVFSALDHYNPDCVIVGGASGADELAESWSKSRGKACMVFDAPWKKHPKAGGPIRNTWMLQYGRPTHFLAFPGNRGTADMVTKCESSGIVRLKWPLEEGQEDFE